MKLRKPDKEAAIWQKYFSSCSGAISAAGECDRRPTDARRNIVDINLKLK